MRDRRRSPPTCASALLDAPGIDDVGLLVVVDEPSSPQQTDVLATVSQSVRGDYVRAARLLGRLDVDVVLLQHEYGIFGGPDGEYVLSFARELSQPLVVTLHTLLSKPAPHQLDVLTALCREAERVIVMTETARRLLIELRACPAEKIRIVPHGAPALLGQRRAEHAAGRRPVYVTPRQGRLRGDAGSVPALDVRAPIGRQGPRDSDRGAAGDRRAAPRGPVPDRRAHPSRRWLGARARSTALQLERQVVDLGLEGHVAFDDRFLSIDELADLLAATDVFVTPYSNREQIASGALTFALAAGCAAVSTPYWYAEDVLASGAGTARAVRRPAGARGRGLRLHRAAGALAAARLEAQRIGSELRWSSVAEATAAVLREAAALAPTPDADPVGRPAPLPGAHRSPAHAGGRRRDRAARARRDPEPESGYCVDDVARLAVVALELERRDGRRSAGRRSSTARSRSSTPPRTATATACATS